MDKERMDRYFLVCFNFPPENPFGIFILLNDLDEDKRKELAFLQQYGKEVDIYNSGKIDATASGLSQEWVDKVCKYQKNKSMRHFTYNFYPPASIYPDKPREWLIENILNKREFFQQPMEIESSLIINEVHIRKEKL